MHYVYYLLDPDTEDLLYIGRSNRPLHRLYSFVKKKGRQAKLGVCQRHRDLIAASKAELKAINKYWPPYNKQLISSFGSLGKSTLRGRTLSDEHKAKIGHSVKGHVVTEETRAKIRAKLLGHAVSQETRDKIGRANSKAHSFGGFAGGATITKTKEGSSISQY